jgi:streptomycin 6-kinase
VNNIFERYIARWALIADGMPIRTHSSRLLPVRWNGVPAMLKVATADEERAGALLMAWWGGQGAAQVFAHEGDALLMERAEGNLSLAELVGNGDDDAASLVICKAVAQLHARAHAHPPDTLVPLARWFRELDLAAPRYGGILTLAATSAHDLLMTPQDVVVLHGDIHHANILDFGQGRGWLAIDPKGLIGERGFDYANLFCNPDQATATAAGRLTRQANIVAAAAGLPRKRLLQWVLAYAGLSAAWTLNDGETPEIALAVAELAAQELAQM